MYIFWSEIDKANLKKYKDKQIVVAHNLKILETLIEVENEINELLTQFPMKELKISKRLWKKIRILIEIIFYFI